MAPRLLGSVCCPLALALVLTMLGASADALVLTRIAPAPSTRTSRSAPPLMAAVRKVSAHLHLSLSLPLSCLPLLLSSLPHYVGPSYVRPSFHPAILSPFSPSLHASLFHFFARSLARSRSIFSSLALVLSLLLGSSMSPEAPLPFLYMPQRLSSPCAFPLPIAHAMCRTCSEPGVDALVHKVTTAEFEEELQDCSTPILLDVFAVWCGPCQLMAPQLEQVSVCS